MSDLGIGVSWASATRRAGALTTQVEIVVPSGSRVDDAGSVV